MKGTEWGAGELAVAVRLDDVDTIHTTMYTSQYFYTNMSLLKANCCYVILLSHCCYSHYNLYMLVIFTSKKIY